MFVVFSSVAVDFCLFSVWQFFTPLLVRLLAGWLAGLLAGCLSSHSKLHPPPSVVVIVRVTQCPLTCHLPTLTLHLLLQPAGSKSN